MVCTARRYPGTSANVHYEHSLLLLFFMFLFIKGHRKDQVRGTVPVKGPTPLVTGSMLTFFGLLGDTVKAVATDL